MEEKREVTTYGYNHLSLNDNFLTKTIKLMFIAFIIQTLLRNWIIPPVGRQRYIDVIKAMSSC